MASIVPNAWRLTSKTVLATEHSAVKKAWGKKKAGGLECLVLPEGKESRHKRIPLFAAFGLGHRVGLSIAISCQT